jgi:hypothetical protein
LTKTHVVETAAEAFDVLREESRRPKRECGACTLCCRLLPVPEHGKPANKKCPHQFSKGCRIYANRPMSCAYWNCRWLAGDDTGQRPDRAHYVIDMMDDFVTKTNTETGEKVEDIGVLQVWVEPGYDVRNDPALRSFIERERTCALLRHADKGGVFMAPPSISADGRWFIQESRSMTHEHTWAEKAAVLGAREIKVVVPQDRVKR